MGQIYTVKLVDEDEWREVVKSDPRYEYVDASNVGFSDRLKRRGYARLEYLKHFPGAKALTLRHEFDHLIEDAPSDEDAHGIRHKKGFLRNAAAILSSPFTLGSSLLVGSNQQRPLLGRPGGGLNQLANAVYRVVPTVVGGTVGNAVGGPGGAALGSAAGSALGGWATGQGQLGRRALVAGGVGGGLSALGGLGNPSGASPINLQGTSGILQPGQGGMPLTGQAALSAFQRGQSTFSPLTQIQTPPTRTGLSAALSNVFRGNAGGGSPARTLLAGLGSGVGNALANQAFQSALGPLALGTGVAGIGQVAGPEAPRVQELGQLPAINQFRTDVNAKLGPLATRLQGLSNTALPQALEHPIRRQFENQRRNLYAQFAAVRPGIDVATDTDYRRAVEDLNQREVESLASAQFQYQGSERQNILAELGVDQTQLGYLQDLSQLDVDTIMMRTGLQAEEAAQFKQMFGQLGATVAGAGLLGGFR